MMQEAMQYLAAAAVLLGAVFGLLAAIGIVRLPDLYTRLHAASKAGVVGSGLILVAVGLISTDGAVILRAILGIIFLLLSTPIAAHLLARAAYKAGEMPTVATTIEEIDA
ncbi:MAG: monovalent cation/H(+) antiporter subunit G [Hyphomicrobiales bacterium]|nr:MAG: monovalent cation/H(+) antiporter subunit G [Hyphomicrobiales bacterium]